MLLIAIPYLVLCAAYRSPGGLRRLTRPGDVSYGIYLLAFPVQQAIYELWGGIRAEPAGARPARFPRRLPARTRLLARNRAAGADLEAPLETPRKQLCTTQIETIGCR